MTKQLACVTGLPRAGSTLLCQLLSHHPDIFCDGHSSPLLPTLLGMRQHISDSQFMKAQMDVDYETSYQRIHNMNTGLIDGWFAHAGQTCLVDKNRGWLNQFDLIQALKPGTKMLVCIRNPEQIYGSIESRHQKSLLLDFPDKLANLSAYDRADKLFASQGVVGEPMNSIAALQEFHPDSQKNIYFVVFEQLMAQPVKVMSEIYSWLGLNHFEIDPAQLTCRAHESDSYYNFKYLHKTHASIQPPKPHQIPTRIRNSIREGYQWFYQNFYPGLIDEKP